MLDESLLIGETIIYSAGYGEKRGVVMGVGSMKFQFTDIFATTAYSVLIDDKGTIEHIPYWQVKGIVEPDMTFLELLTKEGDLVGIEFPKYYKPEHSKGWKVNEGNGNTDLPFA